MTKQKQLYKIVYNNKAIELVIEPDIYTPNIDENGNYEDNVLLMSKTEGIHFPSQQLVKDMNTKMVDNLLEFD